MDNSQQNEKTKAVISNGMKEFLITIALALLMCICYTFLTSHIFYADNLEKSVKSIANTIYAVIVGLSGSVTFVMIAITLFVGLFGDERELQVAKSRTKKIVGVCIVIILLATIFNFFYPSIKKTGASKIK